MPIVLYFKQPLVQILLPFVQMKTSTRLDRLSALLAGVAPRVEVSLPETNGHTIIGKACAERFLHLYLITEGQIRFCLTGDNSQTVVAPAIVVCRADTSHQMEATSLEAFQGLFCARALMDGPLASLIFNEFAEPRAISLEGSDASLAHVIQLIASELLMPRCGRPALLERAGEILFIGLLRHLIAHPMATDGLFSGLADPRIARTLVAMHAMPQHNWTLETLASEAGMSRTAFANAFREIMLQPPGKYLTKLRLAIAQQTLQSGYGLKRAAKDSGYMSPSALSRALSRRQAMNVIP